MLTIVTGNTGKFQEIAGVLEGINLVQNGIDLEEIQTTSLEEISADKCRKAFVEVGGPVLVDDTGIYFDALNEFPGALAKFFIAGVGAEGIKRMYAGVEERGAKFVSVVSYMDKTLSQPLQFRGESQGVLNFDYIDQENPFPKLPYLMFFQPQGMEKPVSITPNGRKNFKSHRKEAVKKFKERYLSK